MSKLPPLKVVGQVDTSQMAVGLKSAEAKVKASQKRMAAMGAARSAATPAMGMLGGGAMGGAMGGLGALGPVGSAIGLGLAAITAPFFAATSVLQMFKSATEGSTEALKTFKEKGVIAPGMNSTVLASLAAKEKQAADDAGGVTLEQAFTSGQSGSSVISDASVAIKESANAVAAIIGARMSGKGFEEAFTEGQIVNASEEEAKGLRGIANKLAKDREQAAMNDFAAGDSEAVVVLKQIWRTMF